MIGIDLLIGAALGIVLEIIGNLGGGATSRSLIPLFERVVRRISSARRDQDAPET